LFIAADTLVYTGNLKLLFEAVKKSAVDDAFLFLLLNVRRIKTFNFYKPAVMRIPLSISKLFLMNTVMPSRRRNNTLKSGVKWEAGLLEIFLY